uniref:(California timema) hypothetical protein n=1 Tax=Timema californicum TaxID=61474 RepID=A0A7R9IYW0_TIMCA|nr:unnamed protein product [Timema californicum]
MDIFLEKLTALELEFLADHQGFGTSVAPSTVDDVILKPLDMKIGDTGKSVVGLRQFPEVVLDDRHMQVAMQSLISDIPSCVHNDPQKDLSYAGQPPPGSYSGGGYQPGIQQPTSIYPGGQQPVSQGTIDPKIQQWFSTVDSDHSGVISAKELQAALVNGQGKHFSDTACRLMIDERMDETQKVCQGPHFSLVLSIEHNTHPANQRSSYLKMNSTKSEEFSYEQR